MTEISLISSFGMEWYQYLLNKQESQQHVPWL